MFKKDILNGHWRFVFASAFVLLLLNPTVCSAETQAARCIDLHLAEMQPSVAEKGRMQDMPDTKAARRVLKRGKRAIPALISCLTDESRTKHSVFPFWPETTVGDIAFVFLTDLFIRLGNITLSRGCRDGTRSCQSPRLEALLSKLGTSSLRSTAGSTFRIGGRKRGVRKKLQFTGMSRNAALRRSHRASRSLFSRIRTPVGEKSPLHSLTRISGE